MRAPVLKIRKKVLDIQGQMRPCVQVQAVVDDNVKIALQQHFNEVILFKRTLYAAGLPEGLPKPDPEWAPYLNNFVRADTCP
ncbi:MAG: hypothetical protein K0U34_02760, partial [Alphaproteobacteria bacterium]|nr:hypothetical protein [Alphaproteobacteria bacterium]